MSSDELCDLIEGSKRVMRGEKTEVENEIEKFQAAERAASQVFDQVKYVVDKGFMDS